MDVRKKDKKGIEHKTETMEMSIIREGRIGL